MKRATTRSDDRDAGGVALLLYNTLGLKQVEFQGDHVSLPPERKTKACPVEGTIEPVPLTALLS